MAGMAEISQVALLDWIGRSHDSDRGFGKASLSRKQLLDVVYRQRVESIRKISTLSHELRSRLEDKGISLGLPRIETHFFRQDGTVRYLIAFADGQTVETVWMPEGDDGEAGDGSEAGDVAERFADMNPSGAVALSSEETPTAELMRGATQKQKRDQRAKQGQNQEGRSTRLQPFAFCSSR